jgi:hypothetical protein
MKRITKLLLLEFVLIFTMIPLTSLQAQPEADQTDHEEAILVGRVSHAEGRVSFYVPEQQDWVAVVKDAPFGTGDALYSEEDGRAELIMPNNTWIRIGGGTQIQLIVLEVDVTGVDVTSGTVRLYNKSSNTVIKATTPFGYVTAPAGTRCDLYVGEDSLEVIALKGKVAFVHTPRGIKFEAVEGLSSLVADAEQVTVGEGYGIPDWEKWNRDRDHLWLRRAQQKGESVQYLPPALRHEAYILDRYGRWVKVYYEGAYRYFWRPIHVGLGWSPFTVGRWTVWHDDHCWIPAEPFGYITHHYGNWVLVYGIWYWAPTVVSVGVGFGHTLPYIGMAWYPGRVGWIHFGIHIGWVPLAPREVYYCHHRWGRRAVVFKHVHVRRTGAKINRFRYAHHAVIINKHKLYGVNRYKRIRRANINKDTPMNRYRVTPTVSDAVVKDYARINEKHHFRKGLATRKPHGVNAERVRHNLARAKASRHVDAKRIRQALKNMKQGRPAKRTKTRTPEMKSRIASATTDTTKTEAMNKTLSVGRMNGPEAEAKSADRDIRRKPQKAEKDKQQSARKVSPQGRRKPFAPRIEGKSKQKGGRQSLNPRLEAVMKKMSAYRERFRSVKQEQQAPKRLDRKDTSAFRKGTARLKTPKTTGSAQTEKEGNATFLSRTGAATPDEAGNRPSRQMRPFETDRREVNKSFQNKSRRSLWDQNRVRAGRRR